MLIDGPATAASNGQRLATTNLEDFKKNLMLIESRLNTSGSYFINAVIDLTMDYSLSYCYLFTLSLMNR